MKKKKTSLFNKIKRFFGLREKLSYEERISWFVNNFYETGMEYSGMLDDMKNEDLDNFEWYGEIINIPKYKDETKTVTSIDKSKGISTTSITNNHKKVELNTKSKGIFKYIIEFFSRKEKVIELIIPKGYMNCSVSISNHFVADTNDSKNFDSIRFPLPTPKHKWLIYRTDKKKVLLIDKK